MENECFTGEDEIIYVVSHGDQTDEAAADTVAAVLERLAESPTRLVLVDITEMGRVSAGARQSFRSLGHEHLARDASKPGKVCFAGGNAFQRAVARFTVMATRRADRVGFKPTRAEAREWLLGR